MKRAISTQKTPDRGREISRAAKIWATLIKIRKDQPFNHVTAAVQALLQFGFARAFNSTRPGPICFFTTNGSELTLNSIIRIIISNIGFDRIENMRYLNWNTNSFVFVFVRACYLNLLWPDRLSFISNPSRKLEGGEHGFYIYCSEIILACPCRS